MELSYALTWMVATSSIFGLAFSLKQLRSGFVGWFCVNAGLLLVVAVGVALAWTEVGYLALGLWLAFVILPNWASRNKDAAMGVGNVALVARWAQVAAILHPFDGHREQARIDVALYHFAAGRIAEAKGTLYPLLSSKDWSERARLELLRLDGRWSQIAAHASSQRVGTRALQMAPLYLRAFGELGELESMWTMYCELPPRFARHPALQLQMACYTGLVEATELLLSRHFSHLAPEQATLLRATTLLVQGQTGQGRELLSGLIRNPNHPFTDAAFRLAHPPPAAHPEALTPSVQRAVLDFAYRLREEPARSRPDASPRLAWATIALLAVLLILFLVALPGGSADPANLIRLGALVIPTTLTDDGVAWRIVAAGFLHLGATHWLMNSLGLWVLGKQIEQLWGGFGMLAIFLGASVGSFGFAFAFVHAPVSEPHIFLGASSGVLGLVGALGTHLSTGYFLHRRRALGGRILMVLAVVGAQFVFDWFTPVVSSMLHVTGLLIGGVLAVPTSLAAWRRHAQAHA